MESKGGCHFLAGLCDLREAATLLPYNPAEWFHMTNTNDRCAPPDLTDVNNSKLLLFSQQAIPQNPKGKTPYNRDT